jgi:hypothetical protein
LFYAVRYEKEDIIELLLNKGPTWTSEKPKLVTGLFTL